MVVQASLALKRKEGTGREPEVGGGGEGVGLQVYHGWGTPCPLSRGFWSGGGWFGRLSEGTGNIWNLWEWELRSKVTSN